MSNNEEWREHTARLERTQDGDYEVFDCDGCLWRCPKGSSGAAAFAEHLDDLGAPDYMIRYYKFWFALIEAETGEISRDALARELFDYESVMEGASAVYSELADLSKPNTAPQYIIAGAEQKYREHYAGELAQAAFDLELDGTCDEAEALWMVAEGWEPGIREQFYAEQDMRANLLRDAAAREFSGNA